MGWISRDRSIKSIRGGVCAAIAKRHCGSMPSAIAAIAESGMLHFRLPQVRLAAHLTTSLRIGDAR